MAWSEAGQGTLPIINKSKWERLPVPLPPLAEQKRIVAKVEQLMKLCDALEAALRRREDRAAKLAEAVVQEMVA
jgi:type I restriction enzyme S subunit